MNRRLKLRIIMCGFLLIMSALTPDGHSAESGEFKGAWIANGTRTPFPFGDERQVFTFKLAGHVNLQSVLDKKKDYWAECVGLADSVTGIIGRCVFKDLTGPEIYLTIQSDKLLQGSQVTGTIVGGTGKHAGISGDLSFNWSSVIVDTDANGIITITGETRNLGGRYLVP